MNKKLQNQRGVGMIEILVSLVILAVGLLSVATLHVNIINQSHGNKAQSEAIAIAESRIELMRNYSDGITTEAEFQTLFTNVDLGNSTDIEGTNATFTRKETIIDANNVKDIAVYVQWVDKEEVSQEVVITSSVSWSKPRSSGDIADSLSDPLIPSATGRARLGDGTVTQTEYDGATPTGDGMRLFDSEDGDYRLVDKDKTIVLTLIDACDTDGGNCTDFVKISGIVYIDDSSGRTASDTFVKASDAAYCQLYYLDDNGDFVDDVSAASHVQSTAGNNYDYFHYTCYLGGGWHGNIGIVFGGVKNGGNTNDKICVGDPNLDTNSEKAEEASRRVYRGMLTKKGSGGEPEVHKDTGETLYYSIGVKDALILPHTGDMTHDFVISEGNDCKTIMTKPDSNNGALFSGVPGAFYCLNDTPTDVDGFVEKTYSLAAGCPYDPSLGPATKNVISGTVTVNSSEVIDSDIIDIINNIYLNTSDSTFNCTNKIPVEVSDNKYTITYACDVYDWGTGWTGYVQLNTDYSKMACVHQTSYSDIIEDMPDSNYVCTVATGSSEILTITGTVTPYTPNGNNKADEVLTKAEIILGDSGQCTFSGSNYTCSTGLVASGTKWNGTMSFETDGGKICIDRTNVPTGALPTDGGPAKISFTDYLVVTETFVVDMSVQKSNFTCPQ